MNHSHLESIRSELRESSEVKIRVAEKLSSLIAQIANIAIQSLKCGGKILFCGNGGSAADAQHLATEMVCRLEFNRPAIAALALTTDTSLITAQSNDMGFESIFSRQIEALGKPGDVLIAITTSGNSENVLKAVQTAKTRKMQTVAFSGMGGGKIINMVDYALTVPSSNAQRIQEAQITIGHIFCGLIEKELVEQSKEEISI